MKLIYVLIFLIGALLGFFLPFQINKKEEKIPVRVYVEYEHRFGTVINVVDFNGKLTPLILLDKEETHITEMPERKRQIK